jgi:hypothetical protein
MDPLDQRLNDAGEAWRRSQRPPDETTPFAPLANRRVRPAWGGLVALATILALTMVVGGGLVLSGRAPSSGASPSPMASLLTQAKPTTGCRLALTSGYLAADPQSGLGLRYPDGSHQAVVWPYGYSERFDLGQLRLIDQDGRIVATAGQFLVLGGSGAEGPWIACPFGIEVVAAPSALATASPSQEPTPEIADSYPDGIPRTIDGEHVYRPTAVEANPPEGDFLIGGWDGGAIAVSCALQPSGSSIQCPRFEGLAEFRGGPAVLSMNLASGSAPGGPGFVVRARVDAVTRCKSIPPGSCPGVTLTLVDTVWSGDAAGSTPTEIVTGTMTWFASCGEAQSIDCRRVVELFSNNLARDVKQIWQTADGWVTLTSRPCPTFNGRTALFCWDVDARTTDGPFCMVVGNGSTDSRYPAYFEIGGMDGTGRAGGPPSGWPMCLPQT